MTTRVQGVLFSVLEEEVGMCIERYKRKQEVKVDVIFTFVMIAIMQVGATSLCQLVKKTPKRRRIWCWGFGMCIERQGTVRDLGYVKKRLGCFDN